MGRRLQGEPAAPLEDLSINVIIDRGMNFEVTIDVKGGSTIMTIKQNMADSDPTGSTAADSFGLGIFSLDGNQEALPDNTVLTKKHLKLECTLPYDGPPLAEEEPELDIPEAEEEPQAVQLPPHPLYGSNSPPDKPVQHWDVIGGGDKGGILVREGLETSSPQCPSRLSTGAVVAELKLEGERLWYKRLSGTGPDMGWVSLSVSGKDLLSKRRDPLFPIEHAFGMQMEIIEAAKDPWFQQEVANLHEEFEGNKTSKDFQKKQAALFLKVQCRILPKYGLDGSGKGVMQMMAFYGQHMWNTELQGLIGQCNVLLRL